MVDVGGVGESWPVRERGQSAPLSPLQTHLSPPYWSRGEIFVFITAGSPLQGPSNPAHLFILSLQTRLLTFYLGETDGSEHWWVCRAASCHLVKYFTRKSVQFHGWTVNWWVAESSPVAQCVAEAVCALLMWSDVFEFTFHYYLHWVKRALWEPALPFHSCEANAPLRSDGGTKTQAAYLYSNASITDDNVPAVEQPSVFNPKRLMRGINLVYRFYFA